jgi:lipoyl(octanoyl) transferase
VAQWSVGPRTKGQPDRKIAATGVGLKNGVTLHGYALNCNPDMTIFDKLVPCGITDAGATSLSEQLARDVSVGEVMPAVERELVSRFSTALT